MNVSSWWLTLCIATVIISYRYFLVNQLATAAFVYTAISAISVLALNRYPHLSYIPDGDKVQMTLMSTTVWAYVGVISVSLIAVHLSRLKSETIENWLYVALLLNTTIVLYQFLFGHITYGNKGYTGFFLNASINGCFNACLTGLVLKRKNITQILLVILSVALSQSSVPIGVLFVSCLAYFVSVARCKMFMGYFVTLLLIILLLGYCFNGQYLFNSSGRFEAYRIFMSEWWDRGMLLFGTGIGTFGPMSPQMQAKHGFMMTPDGEGHWWPAMHSDLLECLFQLGVLGLLLYLSLFYQTAKRLYAEEKHVLFSVLCGLGASSLFNYPFKYAAFGVLLVLVVLKSDQAIRLSGT